MRKLPLAVFLFALSLSGQGIRTVAPNQCVWNAGDNLAWAAPNFDDSAWQPYSTWNALSPDPRIWIRCRADLSSFDRTAQPSIQITLYAAYEAYVDGSEIGSAGNLETGAFTMNIVREWPLPGGLASTSVIALRVTRRVASTVPVGQPPSLAIHAGNSDLLRNRRSALILSQVRPRILPAVCCCMVGILGIVLLPLWFNDPGRRELLLLSISCVGLPLIYLDYVAASALLSFPVWVYFLCWALPAATVNVCRALFSFALAGRRVPVLFWVLITVGNALYLPSMILHLLPVAHSLALDRLRSHQLEAIGDVFRAMENLAPFVAFLPWNAVARRMKPLAALTMVWGAIMMVFFAVRITGTHLPGIPDLQLRWGNAVASTENVAILCLLSALLLLLFREQQQTARERALLAGEMHAAQQVQRMLAPAVLETAPGMRIEVAFRPVREVGGDFYSCRILPGNRQRILIGDVSGKGAAAAMTAAVLIGAAQRRESDCPAALLQHLNLVLVDMSVGGFATCLCAELASDGRLTLANAGHLAPYRNGEEISLESALPLGIVLNETYSETAVPLAANDSLTFLSDGVLEAQNATGELFGFERTRAISTQSAEAIANAAQEFGQEDDITVLTLTFAAAQSVPA